MALVAHLGERRFACDLAARTIRLHDVMRTYLQWNISAAELAALHGHLLDA
jgi:hypothetical protein